MQKITFLLLLFIACSVTLFAQHRTITIKGRIIDNRQQPIPKAQIFTHFGECLADNNGFYKLNVSIEVAHRDVRLYVTSNNSTLYSHNLLLNNVEATYTHDITLADNPVKISGTFKTNKVGVFGLKVIFSEYRDSVIYTDKYGYYEFYIPYAICINDRKPYIQIYDSNMIEVAKQTITFKEGHRTYVFDFNK